MVHMKITKRVKKDLSFDEEKKRIAENLKRMRNIGLFPYNHTVEFLSKNEFNIPLCGIDRSGLPKLFMRGEDKYFTDMYAMINKSLYNYEYGIEDCRFRNYSVVLNAIKEFINIKYLYKYFTIEQFHLYTANGEIVWRNKNDNDPEYKGLIWTNYNSVEICHKILSMIKREMILDKLETKNYE